MHDGMQYDPIQGQGHEPLKVGNPAVFKSYLLHHLQQTAFFMVFLGRWSQSFLGDLLILLEWYSAGWLPFK